MRLELKALPLIVVVIGAAAIAMLVPAIHALTTGNERVSRAFFYSAILFLVLFLMLAIVTNGSPIRRQARTHLLTMVATFVGLPVMLAVPFAEAVGNTTFVNAYVEMISSLTTTGATFYDPDRIPPSAHLWRAMVGWMGGFFLWVSAVAILAPLNLGGFEVGAAGEAGQGTPHVRQITPIADISKRVRRFAARLFPIYVGLTAILWTLLIIAGELPLIAICHAMSVLATSGISPVDGVEAGASGLGGEALMFLFMVFALSRLTFAADERPRGLRSLLEDPELRLGLLLVGTLPLLLFLRHWLGAFEVDDVENLRAGLEALWGGLFTVMSFLTTTGFESASWVQARAWSGLETPGLILMGLCVFGGGVATTAGGVKLLRVYALFEHGRREMDKLVHPSSVGGSGQVVRRIRRRGAYIAWIFFMLFALSIASVMLAFALAGQSFEEALVLTISGLTTTGPLTQIAAGEPVALDLLTPEARAIFAAAMVVGRLETLALIALLNPDFWRA